LPRRSDGVGLRPRPGRLLRGQAVDEDRVDDYQHVHGRRRGVRLQSEQSFLPQFKIDQESFNLRQTSINFKTLAFECFY